MGSKRKRAPSSPSAQSGQDEPGPSNHAKKSRVDQSSPRGESNLTIEYKLVGGGEYSRPADKSLDSTVKKVAKHLGVSMLGLRLTHVRPGGVETDIWDDFDFQALKARALATGTKKQVVRVYSAAMGKTPTPPAQRPIPSSSTPSRFQASTAPTPRSAMRTPGPAGTPRSQKRVAIALPGDPPSTPTPASASARPNAPLSTGHAAHGESKSARRRKKRLSGANDATAPAQPTASTSTTPKSTTATHTAVVSKVVERYKPARPSPLSRSAEGTPSDDEAQALASKTADSVTAETVVVTGETAPAVAVPAGAPSTNKADGPADSVAAVQKAAKSSVTEAPATPEFARIPIPGEPLPKQAKAVPTAPVSAQQPQSVPEKATKRKRRSLARRDSGESNSDEAQSSSASASIPPATPAPAPESTPTGKKAKGKTPAKPTPPSIYDDINEALRAKRADRLAALSAAASPPSPSTALPELEPAADSPNETEEASAASAEASSSKPSAKKGRKSAVSDATSEEPPVIVAAKVVEPEVVRSAEPVATEPVAAEPVAAEPVAAEPAAAEPVAAEAIAPEPLVQAPVVEEPVIAATEPPVQPAAVEPETPAAPAAEAVTQPSSQPEPPVSQKRAPKAAPKPKGPKTCHLCGLPTKHMQKNCPVVKEGVDRLEERLAERRAELAALEDAEVIDEEDDQVLQSIMAWIERLTDVADKVNDTPTKPKANGTPKGTPTSVDATPRVEPIGALLRTAATPTQATPTQSKATTVAKATPIAKPVDVPSASVTPMAELEAASPDSSRESSPSSATPNPPETPFFPTAIHMKALARPRRPGSMSGLSVSDAVIETGDSDSDSSDDDSGSESSSIDSSSGSESDSDSDSDSSSSSSSSSRSGLDLAAIFTKPLNRKQRNKARVSAASIHPITEAGEAASDIEDDETMPRPTQRRGSDSSIGDFEDGDEPDRAESIGPSDSDPEHDSRAALIGMVADQTMDVDTDTADASMNLDAMDVDEAPATPPSAAQNLPRSPRVLSLQSPAKMPRSPLAVPSSAHRPFANLARGESPASNDLDGDVALKEAIDEDASLPRQETQTDEFTATQTVVPVPLPPSSPVGVREVPEPVKRGRGRPRKSQPEEEPSAPPVTQREGGKTAESESEYEAPSALRKRKSDDEAEAPVRRSTRSVSGSQPARRVTRASSSEPRPAHASQPTRRTTRASSREPVAPPPTQRRTRASSREPASQSTAPHKGHAAEPIPEEDELDMSFAAKTQGSLPPSSFPNGATQSSPKAPESPLFMTQPTQGATQVYNAFPPPLVPETQAPESDPVANGVVYSPSPEPAPEATEEVNGVYDSASDDETATTASKLYPAIPLSLPRSQVQPITSSFPTLSSLPKEALRNGMRVWTAIRGTSAGNGMPASQQGPAIQASQEPGEESDSASDTDSEEEAVPEATRSRYAGGSRRKRSARTSGVMGGW